MTPPPLAIAFRIEQHDVLPSTQATMRGLLESGVEVDGLVVRAARQAAGRGRRGRAWQAEVGGSYQTIAVRDPAGDGTPAGRLRSGPTSVAVAIGIAEVLREYGARVDVKWPNDLYYMGKKLGGILAEYLHGHLLVGVGVNVDNPLPAGAAGLTGWDLEGVHGAVLAGLQTGLEAVHAGTPLAGRFAPLDLLAGLHVVAESGGATIAGVAGGIDEQGRLLLARADDRVALADGTILRWG